MYVKLCKVANAKVLGPNNSVQAKAPKTMIPTEHIFGASGNAQGSVFAVPMSRSTKCHAKCNTEVW